MARRVWLSITGLQSGMGAEEKVVLETEGKYIYKEDTHYLFYSERAEGGCEIKNRLTVTPETVELRKSGGGGSVLTFCEAHAQACLYQSPAGPMELVSDTKKIRKRLAPDHFELVLDYALLMGGAPVSDYHLTVRAKFLE